MDAPAVLRHLRTEGFDVRADGDRLGISPWSGLDTELRTRVRECRDEVLALVRAEEASSNKGPKPDPCPECRGRWVGVPGGYRATHARSCSRFEVAT